MQVAIYLQRKECKFLSILQQQKPSTEIHKGDSKWDRLCLGEFIHTLQ